MNMLKDYLKDKKIGFYFSVGISLMAVVSAIVYVNIIADTAPISWWAFAFMLSGCVGAIVLGLLKLFNWTPLSLAVGSGMGLMFYIHSIAYYVSVVMVGIDATEFSVAFIVCTVLFSVTFVLSVANIFLKQVEKDSTVASQERRVQGV